MIPLHITGRYGIETCYKSLTTHTLLDFNLFSHKIHTCPALYGQISSFNTEFGGRFHRAAKRSNLLSTNHVLEKTGHQSNAIMNVYSCVWFPR